MFWFRGERDLIALTKCPLRLRASLLGWLICLTLPACKPASDTRTTTAQEPSVNAPTVDLLVQQAATQYQQRIQQATILHATNTKQMQEAKVLDMAGVTQLVHLEPKREVVRQFLASNQTLKSFLANEEAIFQEELENLNVPPARIKAELKGFQSVIRAKGVVLQKRELDQRIGDAMMGALDFLDGSWGEWNYSKDYNRVQFSQPGALAKYNEYVEAIDATSKEQEQLRAQ